MFREMKRAEKQATEQEARGILEAGEYGVLSTVGEDGYPYGIPLNYVFCNGKIIFHCALDGHKLENIAHNEKVSFCVIGHAEVIPEKFSTHFKSAIAFGRARELDGAEKEAGLRALVEKFSPEHLSAGKKYIQNAHGKTKVVAIDVEHLTAKVAPAPKGA